MQFDPNEFKMFAEMTSNMIIEKLRLIPGFELQPEDEYFNLKEAAKFLGKSEGQVYQWVNQAAHGRNDFPYYKTGKSLRFSKNKLLTWMNKTGKPLEKS